MDYQSRAFQLSVVFAFTSLMSGCAIERAQTASQAKISMVGMPKERVLACMGAPLRAGKAGETEVWTYEASDNETHAFGSASIFGNRYSATGFGSSVSSTRSCKIDVVLNQGRVTQVNYSGLTGGLITKDEECAYAVSNCAETSSGSPALYSSASTDESTAIDPTDVSSTSQVATQQSQSYNAWSKAHRK